MVAAFPEPPLCFAAGVITNSSTGDVPLRFFDTPTWPIASLPRILISAAVAKILLAGALAVSPADEPTPRESAIDVQDRKLLKVDSLDCERIALGEADDYKPCIARLPDGELLLTCFH